MTTKVLGDPERCVVAALPMEQQRNLAAFHSDDDLVEDRPQYTLARLGRSFGMMPGTRYVTPECQQLSAFRVVPWRPGRHLECSQPVLQPPYFDQSLIPPSLKLSRDQPVLWLDRVILSPRPIRFEARLLQRQVHLPSTLS